MQLIENKIAITEKCIEVIIKVDKTLSQDVEIFSAPALRGGWMGLGKVHTRK